MALNFLLSHLLPALRHLSFPREGSPLRFRDDHHVQTMPDEHVRKQGGSSNPRLKMIPPLLAPFIDLVAEIGVLWPDHGAKPGRKLVVVKPISQLFQAGA